MLAFCLQLRGMPNKNIQYKSATQQKINSITAAGYPKTTASFPGTILPVEYYYY